jgi:flagellar biosynthesis protein FlhF
MQVKRFTGIDMQEVLRQVKHELGRNAVILSTRHIKKGTGAFGMFGRSMVEVTAAIEREEGPIPAHTPVPEQHADEAVQAGDPLRGTANFVRALDPLQQDMDQVKELLQELATKERSAPHLNYPGLEREFITLKNMLEHLVQKQQDQHSPAFAQTIMPFYQRLLASGLDEVLARRLAERVQNNLPQDRLTEERYVRGYFASTLVKAIPISGPLRLSSGHQTTVAFVGPTGVGKTTTIAKLAAHYALGEKKKVALLTLDTYRIAAIEQLRIFAKIINLPAEVVQNETELDQALAQHHNKDLILIDTAGRSQRDELQMSELMSVFANRNRAAVHLVLSATANFQNLLETVERFKPLDPASLIFTKLDESNTYGTLFGTAVRGHIPLSYFTTGQRVPEDIEVATPERVVDLLLNVTQWSADQGRLMEGRTA